MNFEMRMKQEERNFLFDIIVDYKAKVSAQLGTCKNDVLRKQLEAKYVKAEKAIDLLLSCKCD